MSVDVLTKLIFDRVPYRTPSDYPSITEEWEKFLYIPGGYAAKVTPTDRLSEIVNKRNSRGQTPLYVASLVANPELVSLLLDAGANVNLPNTNETGSYPIHGAAWSSGDPSDKLEVICILYVAGASTQVKNRHGESFFDNLCQAHS